jgi:gamma-glutamyltranspeptidase
VASQHRGGREAELGAIRELAHQTRDAEGGEELTRDLGARPAAHESNEGALGAIEGGQRVGDRSQKATSGLSATSLAIVARPEAVIGQTLSQPGGRNQAGVMAAAYHRGVTTPPTSRADVRARRGLVVAPHAQAAHAGVDVLRGGGNALDAAVAAAVTIAVVYPHMNSIGGDNVWLLWDAGRRRLRGLNAAGRAAAAATLETYASRFGAAIPVRGGAAALTVPGAVSGWWEVHEYSRDVMGSPVKWPTLFDSALHHAREGFAPSPGQRRVTAAARDLFTAAAPPEVQRTLWPVYHPDRLGPERFVQADLAATLACVAEKGPETFYRGAVAGRIADGAARAGSPLARADLAAHRAEWTEPLRVRYRAGEAATLPPPTQGFAALAILSLLEGFDVAAVDDADHVHLVVEATKLAFEDRDRYLADPALVDVPVARCLDPERLGRRRRLIARRRARPLDGGPAADGDTIAIATADGDGNVAVVIQSTYHEFGSGVVAGDTGVLLQNRGAFFSLDPGHPNCLAPGKRTAHTLIPSMYLVDGRPRFAYGTMGGEGQPQTQAALLTRVVDRDLAPQAAVEAPRWLLGRTWGDASRALRIEDRFGTAVADELRRRGHEVQVVDGWSDLMGHAQLIRVDADGLVGGSDPRADGIALGC